MILYPKVYIDNINQITVELLRKNNIKGLLLDVDNTLIDYDRNMVKGLEEWIDNLKKEGIKMCILSNSNNRDKVLELAATIDIPYIFFAKKPLKCAFKKGKQQLNLDNENIGVVGDQIFTDVIGANRVNMFSILVKPIKEKDIWITKLKRPIERYIIKKYEKRKESAKDKEKIF